MKDYMLAWVEEHKGEAPDGTWFRDKMDWIEDDPNHPEVFATEQLLDDWLWRYIVDRMDYLGT